MTEQEMDKLRERIAQKINLAFNISAQDRSSRTKPIEKSLENTIMDAIKTANEARK